MNDPLTDLATIPAIPIHGAVPGARAAMRRIASALLGVPDDALEQGWRWRADDAKDIELRYAAYAIHERLERAVGAIEVARADAPEAVPLAPGVPSLGAMTAARWDLHGLLAALEPETWDADPGGDEWTVRQTMAHILGSQLSYGWFNAWFLSRPMAVGAAAYPADDDLPPEPTEEELGRGLPAEVEARLDTIADASAAAVAGLDAEALETGARWSGLHVSIGFRLGRYGSHIREHTIQVEKTLAMLHREPTEAERLVRLVLATYGRLEATIIGRGAADLDRTIGNGTSAIALMTEAVADAEATAVSARRASAAS
jgi:hypothetical protein